MDAPYENINLNSSFYDLNSISNLSVNGHALYLSLNIQSLNSKFEEFSQFIADTSTLLVVERNTPSSFLHGYMQVLFTGYFMLKNHM